MTQVYYDQMPSPIGPLFLVADDEGLREIRFELDRRPHTPLPRLGTCAEQTGRSPSPT